MMSRNQKQYIASLVFFTLLLLPVAAYSADHIVDYSEDIACVLWCRGCSPTAASMVLSYWDRGDGGVEAAGMGRLIDYWREYTEYMDGRSGTIRNVPNVLDELRIKMNTDGDGGTAPWDIGPGIKKVCNDVHGYSFQSEQTINNLFNDWCWDKIKEEIDNDRPFVWSVGQLIPSQGHSLAAWGYTDDKYIITYNTWDCPGRDDWYYSEWDNGSGLNTSGVDTVVPGGWSWGQTSLIAPNGGEKWSAGETHEILWFEGDARTWSAELEYSTDGGDTWNWIDVVEPSSPGWKSYFWTIPDSIPDTEKARVRIRNYSGSVETGWHLEAADGSEWNFQMGYDVSPPIPNPPTWEIEPHAISTTEIAMTATTATDKSPPISYYFWCESEYDRLHIAFWQSSPTYTFNGLYANTPYECKVWVADSLDNLTEWSQTIPVCTLVETPTGIRFTNDGTTNSSISVRGTANQLSNMGQGDSAFWVGCYVWTRFGYDLIAWSDWVISLLMQPWEAAGLEVNHQYYFRARARNWVGVLTPYCDYESRYTLANPPEKCLLESVGPSSMGVTISPNGNPSNTECAIRCTGRGTYYLNASGGNNGSEPYWQSIATWGTVTATGLAPGETYEFSAKARNGDGVETEWSPPATSGTRGFVVTSPNGGETWYVGNTSNITWLSYNLSDNVRIELSQNGGLSWVTIAESTENDGTHPWTVLGPATNEALIRITSVLDAAVFDSSNALFTIVDRSVAVTSPNGSEKWPIGSSRDIRWTSDGAGPTVKIEISRDNGATWSTIAASAENNGVYPWTVAASASDRCRMRITSVTYPTVADTSDEKFSIIQYAPGALLGWGDNSFGQTDVPAGDSNFVAVSGTYHNLALRMDGSILGWGDDAYGKLILPAGEYSAVAAGHMHSIALKADGSLVGSGYNYYGQTDVPAGNDFVAVAAGSDHSIALKADGSVVVWGRNNHGQLDVPIPMPPKGPMIIAVAACGDQNLVLRADGSLAGWGYNLYGQVDVPAGIDFVAVATGARHSLALKTDGSVVGWGHNDCGQINVPAGNDFIAIAAGYEHSLALRADGSIEAWGKNDYGQANVPAGIHFLSISAGARHSLGIAPANTQVGNNTAVQMADPYAQTVTATVTFDQVTDAGISRLASSPEGEQLPTGFKLGDPPTYYDVKTTADFTGQIEICISYSGISFDSEEELRLYHYENGEWVDVTSSLDTTNDIICGLTNSLSQFAVLEPANQPPVADAGSDQTVERTVSEGAEVVLDGAGSSDPDSDTLTYEWTWAGGSATGVSPTVTLSPGLTTITLTVSDGEYSAVDTTDISVVDTTAPQVVIKVPEAGTAVQDIVALAAEASDISGVAEVYFYVREPGGAEGIPIGYDDLTGTFNAASGRWEYNLDTTLLQDGYYVVRAKAVDDGYGNEGWSELVSFSIRNWAILKLLPSTQSSKAGRTMPVKFSLRIASSVDPAQPFVYNEDLEIRIYDAAKPGTILQRSYYGTAATDYRINSVAELYITNFQTGPKPATYVAEIWRVSKNWMVGSFTFKTTK